jgi:glyoxylase-like metal-dependent hydrolase (beta-lactamase superfamily II)
LTIKKFVPFVKFVAIFLNKALPITFKGDNIMKLHKHTDNLFRLSGFLPINIYLVREANTLTVIDSGMAGGGKHIVKAAESLNMPIATITLTHAHADHAGSLDELSALVPDAEVALNGRTAQFLQGNRDLLPDEPQAPLRGSWLHAATQPSRLLRPGDLLGSLRVVAATGHTPDQIAFYDERDGTLIAGDAYQTQGGIAVSGIKRWLFPLPAFATWHLPTALETAVTLHTLNPTRLATGHGNVLESPQPKMAEAIRTAEKAVSSKQLTVSS